MEVYWEITTYDGQTIQIPPAGIDVVKRRWDAGEPIHTARSGSIAASSIKSFLPTSKSYGQPLLEASAQAFDEPMFTDDGSVKARWVKKQVTQREYAKHFANIPAYHRLGEEGGLVSVGFKLPIHEISGEVDMCTSEEIDKLNRTS